MEPLISSVCVGFGAEPPKAEAQKKEKPLPGVSREGRVKRQLRVFARTQRGFQARRRRATARPPRPRRASEAGAGTTRIVTESTMAVPRMEPVTSVMLANQ